MLSVLTEEAIHQGRESYLHEEERELMEWNKKLQALEQSMTKERHGSSLPHVSLLRKQWLAVKERIDEVRVAGEDIGGDGRLYIEQGFRYLESLYKHFAA
jgi:hypothetical protein